MDQLVKTLTLKQPWAAAIAFCGKDVENRSWAPPRSMVGERIAIHAGKSIEKEALEEVVSRYPWLEDGSYVRLGAVVATATLVGARRADDRDSVAERIRRSRWRNEETWGWLLEDVVAIPPIPIKGRLGLWALPDELARLASINTRAARHTPHPDAAPAELDRRVRQYLKELELPGEFARRSYAEGFRNTRPTARSLARQVVTRSMRSAFHQAFEAEEHAQ